MGNNGGSKHFNQDEASNKANCPGYCQVKLLDREA